MIAMRIAKMICHNAIVDTHVFISSKALVGAFVHIESLAFIGHASVLVSHKAKKIGSNALIGVEQLLLLL